MHKLSRTSAALLRPLLAACALVFAYVLASPAAAVTTITVDTANFSNARDNELSLFEALDVARGAKTGCFTDHEKNQISGLSWAADIFASCGGGPFNGLWNITSLSTLPAVIQFNSGVTDITVTGALPPLATETTLNGAISGGKVRLVKGGGYTGSGLIINGCTGCSHQIYVRNLKIQGFTGDGITTQTNGLTDSSFTGLEIYDNGGNGIYLSYGSTTNPRNIIIGGPTPAETNLIYHNGGRGIFINGTSASDWTSFDTVIQGNVIGLTGAGLASGNSSEGILLGNVRGVTVGGPTSAYGNTIVHNTGDGIRITGASTGNTVSSNYIGTDSGVAIDRGNGGAGLSFFSGANNNSASANWISGNVGAGISISGSGTNANTLLQNSIGLGTTAALGNGGDGVLLADFAASNVLTGNEIVWNSGNGVRIAAGASSNQLKSNYIGVNNAFFLGNVQNGVQVDSGAHDNQIGTAGAGNYIGDSGNDGVNLQGAGTTGNTVVANLIGLSNGGQPRGNNSGVAILAGASGNTVGAAGAGNTIVSNRSAGVFIADPGTNNNVVIANYIGTNAAGNTGYGNAGDGVYVANGAASTTIGDSASATRRNTISGNSGNGVLVNHGATNGVTITGNFIGTNPVGTLAVANSLSGVAVLSAQNVTIGDDAGTVVQCISGNTQRGIYAANTQLLKIKGSQYSQYIGNRCDGAFVGLKNGLQGILLDNAQHSVVTPFVVAYNGGAGIAVTGASALSNLLRPVLDFGNGGLPIDLGNDGPTANDAGDGDTGPNGLLNYPEIKTITGSTIAGTACINCTIFAYLATGNPRASGGGIQSKSQVAYSNGSGAWSMALASPLTPFNVSLQACAATDCLTAADANTSEASPLISSIDVDGNGSYDALTDGLLILRYMLGLSGTTLTNSAIGAAATRAGSASIVPYLDTIRPLLDVDNDTVVDPYTDGLLLIRYLFGMRGTALTAGAVSIGAHRATPALIEAYIRSLMP